MALRTNAKCMLQSGESGSLLVGQKIHKNAVENVETKLMCIVHCEIHSILLSIHRQRMRAMWRISMAYLIPVICQISIN